MMMVETLDTHWDVKLARERIAAKLHNPKLESDLYPVGSWRDHPPTGDAAGPEPAASGAARRTTRTRTTTAPDERGAGQTERGDALAGIERSEESEALQQIGARARCWGCRPARAARRDRTTGSSRAQHTASGKPLLSNDMHLALSGPTSGTWPT